MNNRSKKAYNHLNDFYKKIFGERVLKIPLDGGFTCPNRDGKKSTGGCIFCSARGSGDRLSKISIEQQVQYFFNSFKAEKANKFIAYFQNYSNTYGSIKELKMKFDSALIDKRIVGLDIATRCDCIDDEICKLLASYKKENYYVQVELGLQSSNEKTHQKTNQLITNEEFIKAVELLNKYDIPIIIHLMVGLPDENHDDIINSINFINRLNYQGIKIHSTYIEENTVLNSMYQKGEYKPLTYEEYMDELAYILTHINPTVIVHRITGDPFKNTFVAPEWTMHKKNVLNNIDKLLISKNEYQGIYYK